MGSSSRLSDHWQIADFLVRALVLGIVFFAVVSHVFLLTDLAVRPWLLLICLLLSCRLAGPGLAPPPQQRKSIIPAFVPWFVGLVAAIAAVFLVWGCLATPALSWDGFVSWELRARIFEREAGFAEFFTRSQDVFVHSRSYPVLQPLLIGTMAQWIGLRAASLMFPFLWFVTGVLLATGMRRSGLSSRSSLVVALCFLLTPSWLGTSGGAVDSGYAEVFMALALVACGMGLRIGDQLLLIAGTFLLPLVKPEGSAYAVSLLVAIWAFGRKTDLLVASLSAASGLLLCWAVRDQMVHTSTPYWVFLLLVPFVLALVGTKVLLERKQVSLRSRIAILIVAAALALLLCHALRETFAQSSTLLVSGFLAGVGRLFERLVELPEFFALALRDFTDPAYFGFLFYLLIPLVVLPGRRRRGFGCPALTAWLMFGFLLMLAAVLTAPGDDLRHELRSRLGRMLLQWTGVAWLFIFSAMRNVLDREPVVGQVTA